MKKQNKTYNYTVKIKEFVIDGISYSAKYQVEFVPKTYDNLILDFKVNLSVDHISRNGLGLSYFEIDDMSRYELERQAIYKTNFY